MRRTLSYLLLHLMLLLSGAAALQAQGSGAGITPGKVKNFPVPFGPTNVGRDFWFSFPANWDVPNAAQYYIRLYITAGVATQVRVYVGGSYLKTVTTKAYDVVTVDFNPVQAQAFTRTDVQPIPPDQVYKNKAIHVEADAPIVIYGINRTSFTSDGMLILPTNGIGREYVVASYPAVIGGTQELPSQYMIVAPYDGTVVNIQQVTTTKSHPEGANFTVNLDKGDVFSSMTVGYGGDQSGVTILANKPVFVAGGQNCTYIPNLITYCCCDHLSETMLPTTSWGKFYHAVPFIGRLKGDIYRIFAAEDNTTIYIDGAAYGTLTQRGGLEGRGWMEYRATGRYAIEFSANKPIYVAQYNTSSAYDGIQSDPFYLVLTPVEQYQTGITFTTPSSDYPLNYVNLICDSAAWYQMEIAPGGTNKWQMLRTFPGASNPPRFFPSKINGLKWMGVTLDIAPGTYRLRSPRPFAGYIYGFSSYDSYGYPLSVAVGDLATPDTVAPDITKNQDCFGTVIATTIDRPDDDRVRSNLSSIELDPDTAKSYNYRLTVPKIPPLEPSITISHAYTLQVIDRAKDAQAIYYISDAAGNVTTDTIRYSAFNVEMVPNPLDFGTLLRDQKGRQTLKIRNNSAKSVTIQETKLQSGSLGFVLISPITGFTLGPVGSPTESVDAIVEFTATVGGTFKDSLGLRDSCGFRYLAEVRAKVVTPVINVTDKDFGPVVVSTSVTSQIEIQNKSTNGGILTIYGATGPSGAPVVFTTPDGLPQPTPFDIAPLDARVLRVSFQPVAVTDYIDTIVFTHNAPSNPENDSLGILKGSGIQASLIATSYDWLRRRIFTGPHNAIVYLKNFGSSPVTVLDLKPGSPTGDVGDFTFDITGVRSFTVNPGDSVAVPVTFTPTATGPRHMELEFETNPPQSNAVISKLDGIGIQGALMTEDYDFGQMNVDERDELRDVYFWIPATPYPDSVTITGFTFGSDQGASGVADFKRIPLDTAVTLIPGRRDTVRFQGIFRAQGAGQRFAWLKAITSDRIDRSLSRDSSSWRGLGTSQIADITGRGDSAKGLCLGMTADLRASVTNGGGAPLAVNALTLAAGGGDFVITAPVGPFNLLPGESKQIVIRFTPTRRGTQRDTIIVDNSTVTNPLLIPILGEANGAVVRGHVTLSGTGADGKGELGNEILAKLVIDSLPSGLGITNYTVRFNYDIKQLVPVSSKLKSLPAVNPPGSAAVVDVAGSGAGVMAVSVTNSDTLKGPGEAVELPFNVLFNDNLQRSLSADLILPSGNCLTVVIDPATIGIVPLCGLNLRMIELTGSTYTLDQNKPNPFNPVTVIRYSLGLDGPTKMYLYDFNGKQIQTLVDEYQRPGVYELTVDVSNIPSGNYYYKLVSGAWSETKMLTVVK